MKTLSVLAVTALLTLTACSGAMTFDRYLNQLEGRPINDADIMLKHAPTGSYQDGDATVYVWQDHNVDSLFGKAVTNRGGYRIGGSPDLIWSGIQLDSCVIRARTVDNIIRDVTYEGNPGGCETIYGARKKELGYNSYSRP